MLVQARPLTWLRTSFAFAKISFLKISTISESYMVDTAPSDWFSDANSMARMPPVEVPQIKSNTFFYFGHKINRREKRKGEKEVRVESARQIRENRRALFYHTTVAVRA